MGLLPVARNWQPWQKDTFLSYRPRILNKEAKHLFKMLKRRFVTFESAAIEILNNLMKNLPQSKMHSTISAPRR